MGKSLGDYNIEQSSSYNIKNIKWTQKNSIDTEKLKNKKKTKKKISPTNIIYTSKIKKPKLVEQISKVVIIDNKNSKNKKKITEKTIQNSSASNCKIKRGFKRPGR